MSNASASQSTPSDSKAPTPTSEVSTASHPTENISRPAVPLTQFRDMNTTDKDSQQKQPDAESSKAVEPEPQPSVTSKKEEQEDDKAQKSQTASKKTKCKHKHKKKKSAMKKSTKKKASKDESSSSDSSSDDSSSSSSSSSSSDSSSEEESPKKKKKKDKKAKKSKKDGKKVKGIDWGAGEEESEDESVDDLRKKKLKKLSKKSSKDKKKGKKSKKEPESSDDDSGSDDSSDEEDEPDANNFQAQIDSLKLQLANNRLTRGLGGLRNRRSSSLSLKTTKSKKKGKKGNPGFQRVDQLWDNELHNYRLKESAEDEENEFAEFAFLVRRCFNWENRYTDTVVDIKSKALRAVLQEVMKNCKSVALEAEEPTIDPNTLFLYLEEFRTHHKNTLKAKIKATKKQKTIKKLTLQKTLCKTLVKYLDTDYADVKKTLYPLLEAGNITFELLWALYKPNEIAITSSYGSWAEPRCFKVDYANKFSTMSRGEWYCVEGRYLEYDGKSFGWADFEVDCESFKGPRKITSLATYPLKYHKEPDAVKKSIIERGQQFVSMEGMQYKAMKGLAFMKKKKQVGKININGRIMIDPATFRRVQPNYPIGNISHNDAEGLMSEDDDDDDSECGCCGSSDEENTAKEQKIEQYDHSEDVPKYKYKWVMDKDGCHERYVRVEVDENGEPLRPNRVDKLAEVDGKHSFSEEELLLTSPVVLGFAFSEKLWLEFSLSGIQDIVYNEGAFDSLVLPPNQKEIVRALVESHKSNGAKAIDDVVVGKGQALNCILHGPPGTGKTLTAESISELLHCPLYMVSAGELGVDPSRLEATLQQILDIAHSWGAILLIDEADVFLEARELHDLQRNALVSIFLRLLEYYQGILILTTNRVNTFDDAFQSRIHVALRYGELSKAARMKVWKMFIEMVQKNEGDEAIPLPASDYEALSRHSLNGRQIKNLVKSAQSLALYEKKPMSMDHIRKVLEVAETFDRDLKGGTGYIDAMRSYT